MIRDAWSTTATDRNYSAIADAARRAINKINSNKSTKSRSGDSSGYGSSASGEGFAMGLPSQTPVDRTEQTGSILSARASGESMAADTDDNGKKQYQTFIDSIINGKNRIGNALKDLDPEEQESGVAKKDDEATTYSGNADNFMPDFNTYSENNLDGMGITDFMIVDPYSDEDREMWRAMTEDDVMGKYYEDILSDYDNDFDAFYNDMIGVTLSEMLADDQEMMNRLGSGEVTREILGDFADMDMTPYVVGTDDQISEIAGKMTTDRSMVADIMYYIYGQNLAGALAKEVADGNITNEEAADILSLSEYNDSQSYGNMVYGYGDDYNMSANDFNVDEFSPDFNLYADDWYKGIENRYTSAPGWGSPKLGDSRDLAYELYGAGYTERDGVEDAWNEYVGSTDQADGTEEAR